MMFHRLAVLSVLAILTVLAVQEGATLAYAATCTNSYTSGSAAPVGYAVAWNPLTAARELLVQATDCTTSTATMKVGSGNAAQYVYNKGYYYTGSAWKEYTLTGTTPLQSNAWYTGSAQATIQLPPTLTYAVGYVCQLQGSTWKCGCRDSTCATSYWQLQGVKGVAAEPAGGGTFSTTLNGMPTVRDDGTILLGGKPYFPFGYYLHQRSPSTLRQHVLDWSSMGLNVLWVQKDALVADPSILDLAASHNFRIITEGWQAGQGQYGNLPSWVAQWKDKQGLLGWSMGDDCDDGNHNWDIPVPKDLDVYRQLKAADPNHLMYCPVIHEGQIYVQHPTGSFDALGDEEYYIPSSALSSVYEATVKTVDLHKGMKRAIIQIAQSFNMGGRLPTAQEVQNQGYQIIAAGAKGLMYYEYVGNAATDNELKAMAPEIRALAPAVLDGVYLRAVRQNPLYASTWDYNGKLYVVVVNATYAGGTSRNLSLTLPAKYANGTLTYLSERLPRNVSKNGGTLTGSIPAGASELLVVTP